MGKIPLTLEDVFAFWQANEAWNPKWQNVAREKGFPNWEIWRRKFLERLALATYPDWSLERVEHPLETVPHWYGGPFSGWIKNVYSGKPTLSFAEIIQQPFINGHDYIPGLVQHFPKLTVLTIVEDTEGRVYVVEGMHRVCALTLLAQQKNQHPGLVFVARGKLRAETELVFEIRP